MKTILHKTNIAAPRDVVFETLASVEGLAKWWTTNVTGDAGAGGLIDFTFGDSFNPKMEVTGVAPSVVSWRCVGGVDQWAENTFKFELEDHDGVTALRFRQDYANELSDDDYAIYNYNWGYYLDSLRAYCETGTGRPFQAGAQGAAP